MAVRIEDVAVAAGVSMKTVSRVLNHEPNVRDETRRRVEEAVAEAAVSTQPLRHVVWPGSVPMCVTLAYDNPSRNYLMEIQSGVLEACRAQQYNLLLAPLSYVAAPPHFRNHRTARALWFRWRRTGAAADREQAIAGAP